MRIVSSTSLVACQLWNCVAVNIYVVLQSVTMAKNDRGTKGSPKAKVPVRRLFLSGRRSGTPLRSGSMSKYTEGIQFGAPAVAMQKEDAEASNLRKLRDAIREKCGSPAQPGACAELQKVYMGKPNSSLFHDGIMIGNGTTVTAIVNAVERIAGEATRQTVQQLLSGQKDGVGGSLCNEVYKELLGLTALWYAHMTDLNTNAFKKPIDDVEAVKLGKSFAASTELVAHAATMAKYVTRKDERGVSNDDDGDGGSNPVVQRKGPSCFRCGSTSHKVSACPKGRNSKGGFQNRGPGNKAGGGKKQAAHTQPTVEADK